METKEHWAWFVCGIGIGTLASGVFTKSTELAYVGIFLLLVSVILYIMVENKK